MIPKTVRIRSKANDAEGNSITAKGPLCVVFDAALLSDAEALAIFMRDDSAGASDDEVQAYGRVDFLFRALTVQLVFVVAQVSFGSLAG